MNRKADIIKGINEIAGQYSAYQVFNDWIQIMAISISNSLFIIHDKVWREREDLYINTMKKYSEKDQKKLQEMFFMLIETLEEGIDDVLGDVYMKGEMGSSVLGQFFTPFHISYLTARAGIDLGMVKESEEDIILNEPSCGGGGMIIATAKVLQEEGIDYQKRLIVIAQDLDWKGVYMSYVQLSLLGINAVCYQGDSLSDSIKSIPRRRRFYTPKAMGVIL
jgi:type I restriction-modification system DNA methylase subunit